MTGLRSQYAHDGYVVIPSGIPAATLDAARLAEGPLQPKGYHWSDGPRVFEAWKSSQAVRDIAWAPAIIAAVEELHGTGVRPFQTINFSKGTNQALHQDAVHFQTLPLGEIVGVWVALEDMDEQNGTLCVVPGPGSYVDWRRHLHLKRCAVDDQYQEYAAYERTFESFNDKRVPIVCSAGSAVIWGNNLLHGGWPIADESRTRYSQATHYFTDRARVGWAPMFSDPENFDYHFKSMRWFDRAGTRREQHDEVDPDVARYGAEPVTLYGGER